MSKLGLNQELIDKTRTSARNVALDVQAFIDEHTTVAVERTVCRLLGIDGVNEVEVPLPNVVVDHLSEKQALSGGAAFYIGNAIANLHISPQEIAAMGAMERLDVMLNDALYGILFRGINMQRTLIDQYFSRVINGFAGVIINTGEDNYLTTADAIEEAYTVLASQFLNEQFALMAGLPPEQRTVQFK